MSDHLINLEKISDIMKKGGARRIIIKQLANNDNSKQQIYLGSDFSVMQDLPLGNIESSGMSKKGAIFKAPLNLFWITSDGYKEQAKDSQIILYPKYPEIRLSGIINKCLIAPSHLMKPPTREERDFRQKNNRFLIIGICEDFVLAFMSSWDDLMSKEIKKLIDDKAVKPIFSVFYEYFSSTHDSRNTLLKRLKEIYYKGYIQSQRLDKNGNIIEYNARNGAGFTLESLFKIIPNGRAEPDFIDWELKAHSGNVVTLMTPEPNVGMYVNDIYHFMSEYASSKKTDRVDFASIHKVGYKNAKTNLTLSLEGYDIYKEDITNPNGGLMLRNIEGELIAGWSFEKLLNHWKIKHSQTCFIPYAVKELELKKFYHYGPFVTLATGAELKKFFTALATATIYYDPGINIKYSNGVPKVKKRNQFRIKWNDIKGLYTKIEEVNLISI